MAQQPVKLSRAMPNEDGLAPWAQAFMDNPLRVVPVLGFIVTDTISDSPRKGTKVPVMAFIHIEVPTDEQDVKAHGEMIRRALALRTGREELPFPAGSEVASDAFPEEGD